MKELLPPRQTGNAREQDLTGLLARAVRDPADDAALFAWYKALADACPYWSRQQSKYTRRWGPQTTELRPLTAWRVMSARLEAEAPFPAHELGWGRFCLEYIRVMDSPDQLRDPRELSRLASERASANVKEVIDALNAAQRFVASGMVQKALPVFKSAILGPRWRRPKPASKAGRPPLVLFPDEHKELLEDARIWLGVLVSSTAAGVLTANHVNHAALAFLGSAERLWLLSRTIRRDWESSPEATAACLLQHREFTLADRPPLLSTILSNAGFGRLADEAEGYTANRESPAPLRVT